MDVDKHPVADGDTYHLMTLYIEYWRHYTRLSDISLWGHVVGGTARRAFAVTPDGAAMELRIEFSAETGLAAYSIQDLLRSLPADISHVDLWLECSGAESLTVDGLFTRDAPVRSPLIDVVICTFHREEALRSNLLALEALSDVVRSIHVVDNAGRPAAWLDAWAEKASSHHVYYQDNLGGAGGFVRGMLEAQRHAERSYLLLMDDDVEVIPGALRNVWRIAAYLEEKFCVGGTMLDSHDHDRIVSIGNLIDPRRPRTLDVVSGDVRKGTTAAKNIYAGPVSIDYCGWWFLLLPWEAVDKLGLPLPLFIRGDDADYGYYLRRNGYQTVAWPEIEIYHDDFGLKNAAWHRFYDKRNSYFRGSTYGLFGRWSIFKAAIDAVCGAMLRFDYNMAQAEVLALRAFNDGLSGLATWNEASHRNLLAGFTEEARVSAEGWGLSLRRFKWAPLRQVADVLRVLTDILGPARVEAAAGSWVAASDWSTGLTSRPSSVLVVSADRQAVARSLDRTRCRSLTVRLAVELVRLGRRNMNDSAGARRLRTRESWSAIFGLK